MTPEQWDSHKRGVCEGCRFNARGRCPVVAIMQSDPEDKACSTFFKTGTCSQYQENKRKKGR